MTTETSRDAARRRSEAYRDRKRRGATVVTIEVLPRDVHGLERLGLLDRGDRSPAAIGVAVLRFLAGARAVADLGEAVWPPGEDEDDDDGDSGDDEREAA